MALRFVCFLALVFRPHLAQFGTFPNTLSTHVHSPDSISTPPPVWPPGPGEPFDVTVDEPSFGKLAEWRREYGPIVRVKPLNRDNPGYVLNDPDAVRHVLIANHRNYSKGVGFERVKMLLGNGIIVSDGDFWRSQRRMMQPVFHRQVIAQLSHMMQDCNAGLIARWTLAAERGETVDMTHDMSTLALEVILRALFSTDLDGLIEAEGGNPFALLVDDFTRDLKLAMRFRGLTKHVAAIMQARREEGRTELDFLSSLMAASHKDSGEPMRDKALIDEVMTIIVAGHETTAGTLNWAWYLLSQHREAEQRLQAEADGFDVAPGFADLESLPQARQVAEEALRLYPPVWLFSRKAIGADRINGFDIPAGADIFLCPYLLHRDPEHWDEPDAFRPERFAPEATGDRHRHVFYPFSLGPRRCVGEFFSMVDMQLHLATVSRTLQLRHVPGEPVEVEPHINLRTRHSIMMQPECRSAVTRA